MLENFDLFESTIQVVENRAIAKEQQSSRLDILKRYEDYKNELKENLQELQASNSEDNEILETNKFMKDKFLQDSVNVRSCFHQIFGYIAEINKATEKIEKVGDSISTTYEENERRFHDLSQSVANTIKKSTLAVNKQIDFILADRIELEEELKAIEENYVTERENWELLTQNFDQDREYLLRIELECEVLRDRITENNELQKRAYELNNSKSIKIAHNIINLRKQLLEIIDCKSDEQISLTEQYQQLITNKHMLDEIIQKNNTTQTTIEEINNIIAEKCNEIKTIPEKVKLLWDQISDIKSNQNSLLQKKRNELLFIKKQSDQKTEIYEKILSQLEQINLENKEISLKQEIASSEHENLIKVLQTLEAKKQIQKKEIENYSKMTQASGSEIKVRICDLETVTNERNEAVYLQESNMKNLEVEQKNREDKEISVEKQIKKNKESQQLLDDLKKVIDQSANRVISLTKERDENTEKMKKLKHKCDFLNKELKKREEAETAKSSKTPLNVSKKSTKEVAYSKQRKRGMDYDSDSSSVDGERLSYAEFMARKAAVENKKLKRSGQNKKRTI